MLLAAICNNYPSPRSTYVVLSEDMIACSYVENGAWQIAMLNIHSGFLIQVATPFSEMGRGDFIAGDGVIVFVAGAPTLPMTLVSLDLSSGRWQEIRKATSLEVDPGYLSVAQPVEFPTEDGKTAHAFFYPPKNQDFQGPDGEKPPLLVKSHDHGVKPCPGRHGLSDSLHVNPGRDAYPGSGQGIERIPECNQGGDREATAC